MAHLRLVMILFFASLFSLGLFLWIDQAKADDGIYKCFANTHPALAEKKNIFRLGDIGIINGYLVKPLAESKHPQYNQWFQWIDIVEENGKLDGKCDFALLISVGENDEITLKLFECMPATMAVYKTAESMGIDPMLLIHFAIDVKKDFV